MNWLTVLANIYKLVPYVVTGIETIHQNESTETKTQLAKDALGIALAGANQVLSGSNQALATSVATAVDGAITLTQNVIATAKNPSPATVPPTSN